MTTEEREDRALTRYVWGLVVIMAVAVGMWIGNTFPAHAPEKAPTAHSVTVTHDEPDWTVAPCDMWATTSHPVLPRYTRTDVCAVQTETGAWYMSSPDNPSPALTAPVTH